MSSSKMTQIESLAVIGGAAGVSAALAQLLTRLVRLPKAAYSGPLLVGAASSAGAVGGTYLSASIVGVPAKFAEKAAIMVAVLTLIGTLAASAILARREKQLPVAADLAAVALTGAVAAIAATLLAPKLPMSLACGALKM